MDRRRYLVLLGAAASGCTGRRSAPGTPRSETAAPTTTPPGTRTAADSDRTTLESNEPYETGEGWVARVSVYRARRAIVAAGDQPAPVVPADRQFLQVGVTTRGDGAPAPEELCLAAAVDGESPDPACTARLEAVRADRVGRLQAVPVPLQFEGDRAAVVWERSDAPTVRWRVPAATVDALRRPPEFVVEGLEVPETAQDGETIEVGITVRNEGGRKDWFVAELGLASTPGGEALELAYGAGESLTKPRDLVADFRGGDDLVVRLDWGLDAVERRVRRATSGGDA
jgi:hypothetical protein